LEKLHILKEVKGSKDMGSGSNIKWAFNSATIMNCPWEAELPLWQEFGWNAAEIWYSKLEPQLAKGVTFAQLARQMSDAGVTPIGMCAGVILTPSCEKDDPEGNEHIDLRTRLDAAAEMGASSLTVITGGLIGTDLATEYKLLVPKLRKVAEQAEERGLKLNLEFLGQSEVNGTMGTCIELVNAVDHPAFGMLFDFSHYYVSASHIEEMPLLAPGKLFMVHVDDVKPLPMEVVKNEERCFPGEGRMDVVGMINHLYNKIGYRDYYSVELYDPEIWELDPRFVMQRLQASLQMLEEKVELEAYAETLVS
jgi:sugar phosphate isomerase/epimerase